MFLKLLKFNLRFYIIVLVGYLYTHNLINNLENSVFLSANFMKMKCLLSAVNSRPMDIASVVTTGKI